MPPSPGIASRLHHPERDAGHSPLVVLIHGTMDRGSSFARVVRLLPDLPVVTYDRRGYGRSVDAEPAAEGIDLHVDDLLSLLDRPSVVVGHSFGGDVALAAAATDPRRIRAAGAFEPPTPWAAHWPEGAVLAVDFARDADVSRATELFLRRMIGDAAWDALPEETKAARRRATPALVNDIRSVAERAPFDIDSLGGVPVSFGAGSRSWPHQREATTQLAAAFGTGVTWIEGARHGAHISHPTEFAAWIRTVVASAGEGGQQGRQTSL